MKFYTKHPAILLLQDGTVFHGSSIGKKGTHGGEICFNTGMTGYQEIYTDPSYFGQVIVNTNAHIGNYGVYELEQESAKPTISGLVVNSFSQLSSRKTADDHLQNYLERNGIVGIGDIDTRQLVRHIRNKGAMNCIISSEVLEVEELKKELDKIPDMKGLELSSQISTTDEYPLGREEGACKVAVLDLGIKKSILTNLTERGCSLRVFPAKTPFAIMEAWGADGYFISNGPGDPAAMPYAVEAVGKMLEADKPVFGICLGHQILALANGIPTYKMHNGHRGLNHPVKNLQSGKSEITSQNHGFAVDASAIQKSEKVEVTHKNLNDNTIEGFSVRGKKAFSVQYHPESSPGPHDSRYLFDQFINLMKDN
ncbi:glutamine-hydrolyzing carbamoyl-phosphate synthase small subunit [Nafulsella turpanensis]|uniref:glutamine-hydrolyzing carbamoyl-phosphate synthase small subunit n=1 Tax=Nafulsella turpanensis TaxID=1265690 RepID=UPI00034771B6|nr:glutamine-hydrolyzing carbamoyl-phosphate synthase small subunit [Nafulsella turpanensis]